MQQRNFGGREKRKRETDIAKERLRDRMQESGPAGFRCFPSSTNLFQTDLLPSGPWPINHSLVCWSWEPSKTCRTQGLEFEISAFKQILQLTHDYMGCSCPYKWLSQNMTHEQLHIGADAISKVALRNHETPDNEGWRVRWSRNF